VRARTPTAPPSMSVLAASAAVSILGFLLLGFVADLTLFGTLRHYRDQQVAYASFRKTLAEGTAPTGQLTAKGKLVAIGTPVALLDIPEISVHEVVFEGTAAGVLESGPGHRRDTVLPGQVGTSVVMGRQAAFGGPFGLLGRLRNGDLLTVTTGQGVNQYRVLDVRRAGDPLPGPLPAGHGRLTLITAAGRTLAPNGVLRVDADLLASCASAKVCAPVASTPSLVVGSSALTEAEGVMKGDASVWITLVLWTQALIVAAGAFVWLRMRWGRWQSWLVGIPVLGVIGIALGNDVAQLLPNLL
jgi:sortase A